MNIIKSYIDSINKCLKHIELEGFNGIKKYCIFSDMVVCKLTLHSTVDEYFLYNFHNVKNSYRKKFLLVYHQKKLYKKINVSGFTKSKLKTYNELNEYFDREIIKLPECGMETFVQFAKKHKKVILKPEKGSLGRDISIFEYTNDNDAITKFICINNHNYICEEYIYQHSLLSKLNPCSLNTVRITSLYDKDNVHIIAAALRMGADNSCVDNLKAGGIGANVDENTGLITSIGKDYQGNYYYTHPNTGSDILGIQLPNWEKVLNVVIEAHKIYKACPILGWDIAITENSAIIVEVNNAPGPMIHQYIDGKPKGEKILNYIKKHSKTIV